jgi:site-specific DNA-methyltransferase (adenine-specific)
MKEITSEVYLEDCVTALKRFNDNHFDLAIVDPPYGLGKRTTDGGGTNSQIKFMDDIRRSNWDDKIPDAEYFSELFRVSKNQIIWGGNYFPLPPTRTIICWEKVVMIPTMSQIEMAWTSFDSPARIIKINNTDKNRFHPTQKPTKLYDWILHNYAKPNDLILDTHLGSGSSRIAAYKGGFNFVGFEIDSDYFNAQDKRFNEFKSQLRLFN